MINSKSKDLDPSKPVRDPVGNKKTRYKKGAYKFKTFEEMEKWRHRMLRGRRPDLQQ